MSKGKKGKASKRKGEAKSSGSAASKKDVEPNPRSEEAKVGGDESLPTATATSGADDVAAKSAPQEPEPPPGFAGLLYRIDAALGQVELIAAALFVAGLTLVAVTQFAVITIFNGKLAWADEMIRFLVFFSAMSAATVAAQQRRMMAIDIVPRLISPKARTILRVVLALFVVFICVLLVYAGWENRLSELKKQQPVTHMISVPDAMLALPIGAALIGLHFLFQAIIDGSYLLHGQIPPETEAVVH